MENYDKAIKLDPDNSITYFRIGEGLQKLGKFDIREYDDMSLSLLSDPAFVDKARYNLKEGTTIDSTKK